MPESSERRFVTVVSGLPRSGTSLLMQVLQAGGIPLLCDSARPPDASNPRGYFELEAVKASQRDSSWIHDARGRAVKVVHALLPFLPRGHDYRVLVARRSLAEVVASQDRMLQRLGHEPPGDSPTVERTLGAQLLEAIASLRERPRTAVLEVAHRDLVREPEPVCRRIDAFLGGGLDVAAMASAVDPRLYRSRHAETDAGV